MKNIEKCLNQRLILTTHLYLRNGNMRLNAKIY